MFAIPGTSSSAHLEENLGARGLELTDEDIAELASEGFLLPCAKPRGGTGPAWQGEGEVETMTPVEVARTLDEVEALRPTWAALQSPFLTS